jgi:hypothetical protein
MMAGMNKAQRIALGIGLAVFAISLLAVPCSFETRIGDNTLTDHARTPFWNVGNEGGIDTPALLIDWTIIGVLTGGAMLLLKKPKD